MVANTESENNKGGCLELTGAMLGVAGMGYGVFKVAEVTFRVDHQINQLEQCQKLSILAPESVSQNLNSCQKLLDSVKQGAVPNLKTQLLQESRSYDLSPDNFHIGELARGNIAGVIGSALLGIVFLSAAARYRAEQRLSAQKRNSSYQ